jgi:hypothetical protein
MHKRKGDVLPSRWGLINVLNQDDARARAVYFEILINASDVSLSLWQRFEN